MIAPILKEVVVDLPFATSWALLVDDNTVKNLAVLCSFPALEYGQFEIAGYLRRRFTRSASDSGSRTGSWSEMIQSFVCKPLFH